MRWEEDLKKNQTAKDWHSFWQADEVPERLVYPFTIVNDMIILADGKKEICRPPKHTVLEMYEEAMSKGAVLIKTWPNKKGLSIAASIPNTNNVWVMADDFVDGRHISLACQRYYGVVFADDAKIRRGNLDAASYYALSYGLQRETKIFIHAVLNGGFKFPITKKSRRLWGDLEDVEGMSMLDGLLYLQERSFNIKTAMAATKTIGIVYERDTPDDKQGS